MAKVPTNKFEATQLADRIVPDGADDAAIVQAARGLLVVLMNTWRERVDYRWELQWVRDDIDRG